MSDLGSQAAISDIYTERNQAVALLAALALRLDYPVSVFYGDPDWPVVFIELPLAGQVSWHISHEEFRAFFPRHIPQLWENPWDGHDNPEKAKRLIIEAQQPAGGRGQA